MVSVGSQERIWATWLCAVASSGPAFLVGCTLGFPSAALIDPDLKDFSSKESDLFGALAPIGALFGSFLGAFFSDFYGRKAALLMVALPYIFGYLAIVYSQFVTKYVTFMITLFVGRFFTGVGLGWSCSTVPVYHAEISSARFRGLFCSFTQLFLSAGLVFVYLLSTSNHLTFYDDALIIISIFTLYEILMYFIPESPRWLVANKTRNLALNALKFLRGPQFPINDEISVIESDLSNSPQFGILRGLREFTTKRKLLSSLLIILIIMCLQQMSGLNASSAYASLIFKDAGVSNPSETASYAVGGVGLCFTFFSIFIIDCLGRKILLLISGIGMLLGTVMLGTHFYVSRTCLNETSMEFTGSDVACNSNLATLAIFSLILFNASFSIGWGPVPWVLLGEMLPMRVRGIGSAMANFVNWGSAAVVTGFYFNYSELVNLWFAWWSFSVFNLLGILFIAIFLKETRKKLLEHIN